LLHKMFIYYVCPATGGTVLILAALFVCLFITIVYNNGYYFRNRLATAADFVSDLVKIKITAPRHPRPGCCSMDVRDSIIL